MIKKLFAILVAFALLCTPVLADEEIRFDDVPDGYWAAPYIYRMVDAGVISGVGGNRFNPEGTLDYASFLTLIVLQFYRDTVQSAENAEWYTPYITAAEDVGILDNVSVVAKSPISRYEVAQVMYNVLRLRGVSARELEDTSVIADWANVPGEYREAVSTCYSLGVLSGRDDKGTFAGETFLTRAEAATVLCCLVDVKTIPEGAYVITPDDLLPGNSGTFLDDPENSYVDGVFYCKHLDVTNTTHGIILNTGGYDKLVFTIKANYLGMGLNGEMLQSVFVSEKKIVPGLVHKDDGSPVYETGGVLLEEELVTNNVYTFTVDVTGVSLVTVGVGSGEFTDAEIWDMYMSK